MVRAVPRYDPTPDLSSYLPSDLEWHLDALCAQVDSEAFFPEKGGSVKEAKAVCARCPVAGLNGKCLQYALDNNERFGIWGGYTERERRRLVAQGRKVAA